MKRFWNTVIEPALEAVRPKSIVEIGSFEGENTRNLLAFCERTGAVLHVVEPAPRYDVDELKGSYGDRFVFHEALSLEALPHIDRIDAVLIDGDHNWYTVFNELREIDGHGGRFPLVILHDVFWPFGRRDMYYDPDTIPEPYRKPHEPKGARPGEKGLLEEGGLVEDLKKAIEEGGPRNGVLTGAEDFLKETGRDLEFVAIPGFHGLGLLFPGDLRAGNTGFARLLETWDLPSAVATHVGLLEEAWIEREIHRSQLYARYHRIRAREQGWKEHVRDLEKDTLRLRQENALLGDIRDDLRRQLAEISTSRARRMLNALHRLKLRIVGSGKLRD